MTLNDKKKYVTERWPAPFGYYIQGGLYLVHVAERTLLMKEQGKADYRMQAAYGHVLGMVTM